MLRGARGARVACDPEAVVCERGRAERVAELRELRLRGRRQLVAVAGEADVEGDPLPAPGSLAPRGDFRGDFEAARADGGSGEAADDTLAIDDGWRWLIGGRCA